MRPPARRPGAGWAPQRLSLPPGKGWAAPAAAAAAAEQWGLVSVEPAPGGGAAEAQGGTPSGGAPAGDGHPAPVEGEDLLLGLGAGNGAPEVVGGATVEPGLKDLLLERVLELLPPRLSEPEDQEDAEVPVVKRKRRASVKKSQQASPDTGGEAGQ